MKKKLHYHHSAFFASIFLKFTLSYLSSIHKRCLLLCLGLPQIPVFQFSSDQPCQPLGLLHHGLPKGHRAQMGLCQGSPGLYGLFCTQEDHSPSCMWIPCCTAGQLQQIYDNKLVSHVSVQTKSKQNNPVGNDSANLQKFVSRIRNETMRLFCIKTVTMQVCYCDLENDVFKIFC